MPAKIDLRLAENSPGPEELAKLAEEVRTISGISPGATMLKVTNNNDDGSRRRADTNIDFRFIQAQATRAETRVFESIRDKGEVRFRAAQELALLRDTMDRTRGWSDINDPDEIGQREKSAALLAPILQDLDRKAALLQYNDSLIDQFLTTVKQYGEFWASRDNLKTYLQNQKPPTLWENVQRQERIVAAMLGELKVTLPQIGRLTEARFLQQMLYEDGVAAELVKIPEAKRGQKLNTLFGEFPKLRGMVPEAQHGFTVTQLLVFYRTAERQIDNPMMVAQIKGDGTLRTALEKRLTQVESDVRKNGAPVSALLPDKPRWEDDAYALLQKLQFTDKAGKKLEQVENRRPESYTLAELTNMFKDNAVLKQLFDLLPEGLRTAPLQSIRADVEASYILRQGMPEDGASAVALLMLPAQTTLVGEKDAKATQDCTLRSLTFAYPNNQVLLQFCAMATPEVLALRLKSLQPHDLLRLRAARTGAYADNVEKRSRDLFRIGEPWNDARGKKGTYETKVATNLMVDVMLADSDRLCDEIFTSGNAQALPTLIQQYKAVLSEQMKAQEQALAFNAHMMELLAVQRHFGPMTRLPNFNQIRLDPRQITELRKTLPKELADELDVEWERYGVGLKEYLDAVKTAADRYANAVDAAHEKMIQVADRIAQKLAGGLRVMHNVAWAVPDYTGIGWITRKIAKAAGSKWIVDMDELQKQIEDWKGEFVTLSEVMTTFKTNSNAARSNVLKDVTLLEKMSAAVPTRDLAACTHDPRLPDTNEFVTREPRPTWLPEGVKSAYLAKRAARTAIVHAPGETDEQKFAVDRRIHIADDELRAAEQVILEKYVDELIRIHAPAKAALAKARADRAALGPDAGAAVIKAADDKVKAAYDELDGILADVSGVYVKVFEQMHSPDIPAMHAHVKDLIGELGKKIEFHGGRFHEYDQMQYVWYSAAAGAVITILEYNFILRPLAKGILKYGWNKIVPSRAVERLPTIRDGLRWGWNNTVARLRSSWRVPGAMEIPPSGAINWSSLKPEVRANYVKQLGTEAEALAKEAQALRSKTFATGGERAKAFADLEKRAIAFQERLQGLETAEYRQIIRQGMNGTTRTTPITDVHLEMVERAHLTGGKLPAGGKWPAATLAEKKRILMGLDPHDPNKGLRLNDGTVLEPPAVKGQPATYPAGHPEAGRPASFSAAEADDILRTGMAGERAAGRVGRGLHMPNPYAIASLPENAVHLRRLLNNPGSFGNFTRAELKALTAELKTLEGAQARVAMEELQAAARTDAKLAQALEGSKLMRNVERVGQSAAHDLAALKTGGMVVFEVAMLAFQLYMFYESIQAYNKAVEQSKESVKNMREQVLAAGFYQKSEYEYHNPKLDCTINLYDLERGLGAEANARWREMVMSGVSLGASAAITVLSMTSVIGGPVTIALMVGVVIIELVVNKISEKIKEGEQKEFLAKCPAWLLLALGTMQSVHDTPDGFLRKLELGGGVDEAAAKKLVFIMWIKHVRQSAPEVFNEISMELVTWQDQEKFFNEKFVRHIYPEWKRCLFMRVYGRAKGTTVDDDTKMNELVKNYYLSEYIPIADMIKTQEGASTAKIRQALIDATVGSLNAARVQRYTRMYRRLQTEGDSLVEGIDPPEYLSTMVEAMGRQKTWELTGRPNGTVPGFAMNRTIAEHTERWHNREHGKWLLVERFGATANGNTGATLDVGGGKNVSFTWSDRTRAWTANLPAQEPIPVTVTTAPAGLTGAALAKYRVVVLALLGSPVQQHDDWTKLQHGRWLLTTRYGAKEGDDQTFDVQVGVGAAKKLTYKMEAGGAWKWRKGASALAALTTKPDGLSPDELKQFNEIATLLPVGPDVTPQQASMRMFVRHAEKTNISPDALAEPAMYANAPEELYEAITDPVVRMRCLNAFRGEKGAVTTAPWAEGWKQEDGDQQFAVATLIRGTWGIPRAQFGHDALGSAIRYEQAGGLFSGDGERPHMRRITSAALELFRKTSHPIPVGYNDQARNYIFSDMPANERPLVLVGARRRGVPSVPSDEQMNDCFKQCVDHTLTLDGIPTNGPDTIYGDIRKAYQRRNLQSVTVEGQLFNEGERRNKGYNKPEGEEDVFVAHVLLKFHDGNREYYLRRGVVFRKNGEGWRPVWGEAVAETSSSISPDARKHERESARLRRMFLTLDAAERSNAAALAKRAEINRPGALDFTCRPDLAAKLIPGRTNRPLIYVSPENAPADEGTPAYDLIRRLVQRQQQDASGQIDNPAAYFIELTDRAHGAGALEAEGNQILTDTIVNNPVVANRFITERNGNKFKVTVGGESKVALGGEDDAKSLVFFCNSGRWVYEAGGNEYPVSRDVTKDDVGGDAEAAGRFNRHVLLLLRGLKSKPVLEALATAVPRGQLGGSSGVSRQAAIATCEEEGRSGDWKKWNIEVGANVSHVRNGVVDRSLWLSDALSVQHVSEQRLTSMIQDDSRADVRVTSDEAIGAAMVIHNLNTPEEFPPQGFLDLPPIPGRVHKQVLRQDNRTAVFQERLPNANARTTRAFIRFETGSGLRVWPTPVHFNGMPKADELAGQQSKLDDERAKAARSWGVDVSRLSVTYFLSPEAEGSDSFTIDNNGEDGVTEQYGVSSASQIMQLHSLHQRQQILDLLATPVLKNTGGEWTTDAPATLNRMLRYFMSEVTETSSASAELVTALTPMLLRAPDQKFFLRQLFHTLLSEGSIRRDNLARISRTPDLVRAADSIVVGENTADRVVRLPNGVELSVGVAKNGTLKLRASDGGSTTYDIKLERVPRNEPERATEIDAVSALEEGGNGYAVADLKKAGDDRVCLTVSGTPGFGGIAPPIINRLPISLVGAVAWDALSQARAADNRVVATGTREYVMASGEGAERRTYVLRRGLGGGGGREVTRGGTSALSYGPMLQMREFDGDDLSASAMQYSFDNIGVIHAFPPSEAIRKEIGPVSALFGRPRGDQSRKLLAEHWGEMPAALRTYDGKRPLTMPAADIKKASEIVDEMLSVMAEHELRPRERQFVLLLTELQDELLRMGALPRLRTFLTTPRTAVEPGQPGFSRAAFEAPIADILGLYYHVNDRDETSPSLNRARFTAHMAALYRTLKPEQRREMLERMLDTLSAGAVERMAADPTLKDDEKRLFVIDSALLEKVRATEYLRLKHGATVNGDILTVAGAGKNLEFSFRKDMMYYRKPGGTWKDITVPVAAADVDNSADAVAHFNGTVMPDLLAGLDMLSRSTLNRLHVANELRRMPNVTEANGAFTITIDGKSLTVRDRGPIWGWSYASRQPVDNIMLSSFKRRTEGFLEDMKNPPVQKPTADRPYYVVTQQNVRSPKTLRLRLNGSKGWEYQNAASEWKNVHDPVAAADVGGSAPAAKDFNDNVLPNLGHYNGIYWPVGAADINGTPEAAKKFTDLLKPLSRDYGNVNTGVLNRMRGLQVMAEFKNPAVTERAGVFTVSQQGVESPKTLAMRFEKDGWEFRDAGNTWRHIYNLVLAADVGGSETAAQFFNTSVLPKFTHAMLRRTATLAAYEQLMGNMADERELNRVRARSNSPFFQPAVLSTKAQRLEGDDEEQVTEENSEPVRERQFVRYVPEAGRYIIVPEVQPEGPGFRFGIRADGDAETEWITVQGLRDLTDPKVSADRRALIRAALATPFAHFSHEALSPLSQSYARGLLQGMNERKEASARLQKIVKDGEPADGNEAVRWRENKAAAEAAITDAQRRMDASLVPLNRELNLLPSGNRAAREQFADGVEAILRQQEPRTEKGVRLNVAGDALELYIRVTSYEDYKVNDAFTKKVADLRAAIAEGKKTDEPLAALNAQMNAIEEVSVSKRDAYVRALNAKLSVHPPSRMTARLNVAQNAIELVPVPPDAADATHRRSLKAVLDLCQSEGGADDYGSVADFKPALLEYLVPRYERAIRKEAFLDTLLTELQKADFRIDAACYRNMRRVFADAERDETFVPLIDPAVQQDLDLGGCVLRTRPDGPGKLKFEAITPAGAPGATIAFNEDKYDYNWATVKTDNVLAEADWGKLLTVTITAGSRTVVRNMPLRINTPAAVRGRELARDALLRERLRNDLDRLSTEAGKDEPAMADVEAVLTDINAYLPRVKDADGKLLNTKDLLHTGVNRAFTLGRLILKGNRGIILAEVSGEGADAVPVLRLVRADVLRSQLRADWLRMRGTNGDLAGLRAQVREFNGRLKNAKDLEMPFLTEDMGSDVQLPGQPGYRLFIDRYTQEVSLGYAPFEAMPRIETTSTLPEVVLAADKKTTVSRTEPGEKGETIKVEIAVKEGGALEYKFENAEGADDAAKLRDLGLAVEKAAAKPGDPEGGVRVRLSVNNNAEHPGTYVVSVNEGAQSFVPATNADMKDLQLTESRDNRGKWVKPDRSDYHLLCVATSFNRLAFYRAKGEVRERLTPGGFLWEAVPAEEARTLPALPK